jgi:hypothetical protein
MMGFITRLTQTEPIIEGNYIGFFGYDFTIVYDMTNDVYSYFIVEDELNNYQLGTIRLYILSIVNRLEYGE